MRYFAKATAGVLLLICSLAIKAQTVTEMQWWFDDETPVSGTSAVFTRDISTNTLSEGLHTIHIRLKDSEGRFSAVSSSSFMKLNRFGMEGNKVAEFWIDEHTDRIRTVEASQSGHIDAAIATDHVPAGLHTLYYRAAAANGGMKGSIGSATFLKLNNYDAKGNSVVECWIDDKLSQIQSFPVPAGGLVNIEVVTDSVASGLHTLYYRAAVANGGMKGSIGSATFLKLNNYDAHGNQILEFWFDNDVAQIQTVDVPANGLVKSFLSTATLAPGMHFLNFRVAYSDGGSKSETLRSLFLKLNDGAKENARVLQYWFDNNEETVQQTSIATDNDLIVLNIDAATLSDGGHIVSFRYGYDGGLFSNVSSGLFMKGRNPFAPSETNDLFITEYAFTFDNDTTVIVAYSDSLQERSLNADFDASFLKPDESHDFSISFLRNDGARSMAIKQTFAHGQASTSDDSDTLVYNAAVCFGDDYQVNGFNIENATISGAYYTNRTIKGIDRIVKLNLTVYQPIGNSVSNIQPAAGATVSALPVGFSWKPVANASEYDFYLWPADSVCPEQPVFEKIGYYNFELSEGLEYGNNYLWKIKARNNCGEWESPVHGFTLRQIPNLHLSTLTATTVDTVSRTFTVNYIVQNDGLGATIEPFWIDRVWLVPDIGNVYGTRQANTVLLLNDTCPASLAPGESYSREKELTLPGRWYGDYTLVAATDMANVSSVDWTPAGGAPPATYQPSLSGSPYPYLFANASAAKRVFELDESASHTDNFFFRSLSVPRPPLSPKIIVSKDTVDFGSRTVLTADSVNINIALQDLQSPLILALTGDTDVFEVSPATNFTDTTGGWLTVKYSPTELGDTEALLTLTSDTTVSLILFKGNSVLPTIYSVSASTDQEIYSSEDTITISGKSVYNNGTTASEVAVRVAVTVMGYTRHYNDTTDIDGNYSVNFKAQTGEAGHYSIRAYDPNRIDNSVKAQFDIPGFKLGSPYLRMEVEKDIPQTGTILFANRSNIPLYNIVFEVMEGLPNASISINEIGELQAGGSALATYTLLGTELTASGRWEEIKMRGTSAEGIIHDFSIWFYCKPAVGNISVNPTMLDAKMVKGANKIKEFVIKNNGSGSTGEISISLPPVEYLKLANSNILTEILPGDSAKISLWLCPTDATPLNTPLTGSIAINCANGFGASIPYTLEAISDKKGSLVVDVIDEYYYNTADNIHLKNARVVIAHPYSFEIIADGFTNEQGLFTLDSIPEGYYAIFVEAENHSNYRNNIQIEAGKTLNHRVFISFNAITYSWTVVPTEIEDNYEIRLNTVFTTTVPVPVIQIITPDEIPQLEGGEEYYFDFKLKNIGLIGAHNVTPIFPENDTYLFVPLIDKINYLESGTTQSIPVSVVRKDAVGSKDTIIDGKLCHNVFGSHYEYYCGEESNWKFTWRTVHFEGIKCEVTESKAKETIEKIIDLIQEILHSIVDDEFEISRGGRCEIYPAPPPWWIPAHYPPQGLTMQTITDCAPCDGGQCAKDFSNVIVPGIGDLASGVYNLYKDVQKIRDGEYDRAYNNLMFHSYENLMAVTGSILEDVVISSSKLLVENGLAKDIIGKTIGGVFKVKAIADVVESCGACLIDKMWNGSPPNFVPASFQSDAEYVNKMRIVEKYLEAVYISQLELTGDSILLNHPLLYNFLSAAEKYVALGLPISETDFDILTAGISDSLLVPFVNRWNNTLEAWKQGIYDPQEYGYTDIISLSVLNDATARLDSLNEEAKSLGFASIAEMAVSEIEFLQNFVEKPQTVPNEGVCASVSLQIDQKMTFTREAFRGSLTIHNGHESLPMKDIDLSLEVRDSHGELRNDLFHIETESMLGALTAIDGTGTLTANSDGTGNVLFIPTLDAAPTESKSYSFGGKLTYLDPFTDDTVSVDLFPVQLEVHPGPNLHLYYFMQRDIFGDDPLTTDTVEPVVPANLGIMIQNKGYGAAKNLSIESAQPEIVENEKGLAVNFEIIGSQLNGEERNLGVTDIDFGDLSAQSVKIGQWWLTSSLLGHFTSFNTNVRHLDSRGRADLSLVDSVEMHELIRFITNYNEDDGIFDFLVNDQPDAHDYPDAIYFSNATRTEVSIAKSIYTDGPVRPDDMEIALSVEPSQKGWNYAQTDDPSGGKNTLLRVVRQDNREIPLSNVWQTYCTLPDRSAPLYENKLHIVDTFSTDGLVNYTLFFGETSDTIVTEISQIRNEILLFPNPARDEVKVYLPAGTTNCTITITDIAGRVVALKQEPLPSPIPIDISHLSPGVYIVKINEFVGRFVKE